MSTIYKNVWFAQKVLIKVHSLFLFKILKLLTICGVVCGFQILRNLFLV